MKTVLRFNTLIAVCTLFCLSGCATYLERSSMSQIDARHYPKKPYDWPCRDRDGDGISEGTRQTYPATHLELNEIKNMFSQPSGMLVFLPFMVIDLPISIVTDTAMYPFDKKSVRTYKKCLDSLKMASSSARDLSE